jgi:adenine-specific DNA-methyltransferase
MANELQELLNEIRDTRLKERLSTAVGQLRRTKKFGLVFEQHLPELLPIYSAKIRSHTRVARKDGLLSETFTVERVSKGVASVKPEQGEGESQNIPVSELVVVKRFGEAIFPTLRPVESLVLGGEAPHHTLIEADNYHALQLLEWLYAGKVDCIYIDPPYNTGAKDWKYNNNYVDSNDGFRHSKWLSMMSRRLKLARRLLRDDGVLIVTIDEHEVHHLGMLLEQEFPDTNQQMVTIVVTPGGVTQGRFSRVEEHALFCFSKNASPSLLPDDFLSSDANGAAKSAQSGWQSLIRRGVSARREDRFGMFFPIYVDPKNGKIIGAGEPLPRDKSPDMKARLAKTVAWPIRSDGTFGRWRIGPSTFLKLLERGFVKLGKFDAKRNTWTVLYLQKKTISEIENGTLKIIGRDSTTGAVELAGVEGAIQLRPVKTVWNRFTHHAGAHGSTLLRNILGGATTFSFPKSIYATRDAINTVLRNRPDALVLDFFAGSGTTLNAVTLLNATDGGRRRCILVTNNEVSAEEVSSLSARGVYRGSDEWEEYGICRSVTFPRCKFVIKGKRNNGTELPGEYLTGQFEEREIQRSVRSLDFATPKTLASKRAREALAVAVGFAKSKVTGDESFLLSDGERIAVLFDPDQLDEFIEQGEESAEDIETIYLPFSPGSALNAAKGKISEAWPPLTKNIEIKRPLKEGFAANLDYFRLDFLDRAHVETGGKLADILPSLWMMAGCRGRLPTCKGTEKMLFYKDCPFAMLVDENALKTFLAKLEERTDIDWAFLVTNDQDSFSRMCEWLPDHIPATQRIHLWRNYVDNFLINVDRPGGDAL